MEKFWQWLMKADAKGLFVASLALLGGVSAWWAVNLARAPREEPPGAEKPAAPLELATFKPIGVIGFVSNQFAPETLIVPVNPFHPTFEAIVKALVRQSENGVIIISDKDGEPVAVHFENGVLVDANNKPVANPFQRDLTPRQAAGQPQRPGLLPGGERPAGGGANAWRPTPSNPRPTQPRPPTPPQPKPQVSFSGVMQRPDGTFAAYVTVRTGDRRTTRFVRVGDKLGNATVTASGRDGIELTFDDGTRTTLGIGDEPVALEP